MKKAVIILLGICCEVRANATIYTNDISNACGTMPIMMAEFSPIQYTCSPGYFLPAYTAGCVACPIDATCDGGTFYANTKFAQGITYNSPTTNTPTNACSTKFSSWVAVYGIDCSAGYYLPANSENCAICPANSYCPGGSYPFNKTTAQGITACPTGTYSPAGMWKPEQCGRILHVGDWFVYLRATKKTEHALHVDLDHDGIADYFGNMTTLDVPMSHETERKLKIRYNNTTYSVYDDSVDLSLYQGE